MIWSNLPLKAELSLVYQGSCQAKSWVFWARDIPPLRWANYPNIKLFPWWRICLSAYRISPKATRARCFLSCHHASLRNQCLHLPHNYISGIGRPWLDFRWSRLFSELNPIFLQPHIPLSRVWVCVTHPHTPLSK